MTISKETTKLLGKLANEANEVSSADCRTVDFDLLQSAYPKVNENAHTRILAELLKIPAICESFFQFLDHRYPNRGLSRINDFSKVNVRCFSDYMDACIEIGSYKIIIENKVNGASDQFRQIDRYVNTGILNSTDKTNIFVLYLTRTGGMPSDDSFTNEAKKELGYVSEHKQGRFFALNYRDDILDWINDMLAHDIWLKLEEAVRDVFRSGIVQYRHYIEGGAVLGLRQKDDGYLSFRKGIEKRLDNNADNDLAQLAEVCTCADYNILYSRQLAWRNGNWDDNASDDEKRQILKTFFYSAFNRIVPEDRFYETVPIFGGSGVANIGLWESASLAQVDVWYLDGNIDNYSNSFSEFKVKYQFDDKSYKDLEYNGQPWRRFYIASIEQLREVLKALGGEIPAGLPISLIDDASCRIAGLNIVSHQIKLAMQSWCSKNTIAASDKRWNVWIKLELDNTLCSIDSHYSYRNGWAIQLNQNFAFEPVRAIDVFAKRGTPNEDIHVLQRHLWEQNQIFPYRNLKWDGRVYYHFPIPTQEYGKELLQILWNWRQQLPCS